jgi:hypothetical protein
MPTDRPASAGRRGPLRREPTKSPTGYRVTDRRKFELKAAALFTGIDGLQDVIDLAVEQFLDQMHTVPGFTEALAAAETIQRRRSGVREIPRTTS